MYEIVKVYPDGIAECDVPPGYEDTIAQVRGRAVDALLFAEEMFGEEVGSIGGGESILVEVRDIETGVLIGTIGGSEE